MPEPALTIEHNTAVAGDILTTVTINHHWRRLVCELLAPLCYDGFWSGSQADIETAVNNACDLIRDLYDPESTGMNVGFRYEINPVTIGPAITLLTANCADPTALQFDTDNYVTCPAGTPCIVPAGLGGVYLLNLGLYWNSATLRRIALIKVDGQQVALSDLTTGGYAAQNVSAIVDIPGGGVISFYAYSSVADALLNQDPDSTNYMAAYRLGDLP